VPIETEDVTAATAANVVSGSARGLASNESPIQTESKPAVSAWVAIAPRRRGSPLPSSYITNSRDGRRTPILVISAE